MINLECKYHIDDFRHIRRVLRSLGATRTVIKRQKDYFFNLPTQQTHARLKLRIDQGKRVLIYYVRRPFRDKGATPATVRFYTLAKNDRTLFPFLTTTLGIRSVVEKKREVWRSGNAVFNLDTVKDIGRVFEIELQKRGKISKHDRLRFVALQKTILPFVGKRIATSNGDLILTKKK